jgi:hypothetical protein
MFVPLKFNWSTQNLYIMRTEKENSDSEIIKNINLDHKWEIITKEYSESGKGDIKLSKVVYQLKREFFLKAISALAVFIAFMSLLFNLIIQRQQNKFQLIQQKALLEFGVYTNSMSNLNIVSSGGDIDSLFLRAASKLTNENIPQIMLLGNKDLTKKMIDLRDVAQLYQRMRALSDSANNAITFGENLMATISDPSPFPEGRLSKSDLIEINNMLNKQLGNLLVSRDNKDRDNIDNALAQLPKKSYYKNYFGVDSTYDVLTDYVFTLRFINNMLTPNSNTGLKNNIELTKEYNRSLRLVKRARLEEFKVNRTLRDCKKIMLTSRDEILTLMENNNVFLKPD